MSLIRIGRNPDCDLVLDSPLVSRYHAELELNGSGAWLRDLDSANGTFVGGQRVSQAQLRSGQGLYLANVHLLFDGQKLSEDGAHSAVGIEVEDVSFRPPTANRMLLDHIRFSVRPGQFVALVGTSGAGKSTLMSLLLGQQAPTQGAVLINGQSAYAHQEQFRHLIGFVPQDDIVHRVLPVEAALDYAARLRLPADTSLEERQRRVEIAMTTMELGHRREVAISRLSGGERKRVSMAAELLTEPSLLFLDEPTSGLDPGMEKKTMQLLSRLCRQGRTVVLITHATQNIVLCDQVALLAPGGRLVYYGPPRDALEFFEVPDFAEIYLEIGSLESGLTWQKRFNKLRPEPEGQPEAGPAGLGQAASRLPWGTSWRQWWVLSQRYSHQLWADRSNLMLMALQAPLIGLVLSLLFDPHLYDLRQIAGENSYPIKEGPTLLFLLVVSCLFFGSINSCREIVKELPILRRERLVNLRLLPYFLSKVAVLSLVGAVQAMALLAIVQMRIPLGLSAELQMMLLAFLVAAAVGGTLLGLMLSCLAGSAEQASSLVSVLLILQLSLSGAFIKPEQMLPALRWISCLSISRWTFAGVGSVAGLNARFMELQMGWISSDFYLPMQPLWGIIAPLLGMHALIAIAALRWREGQSER
ncbi:MAG: ATP-binding cassette domain-containing protein [Candidatus Eremiobacteraeota bacterium]|nr:ATP-binding cassette domain-containing protein [Candidatus Eremiobacteraeota bacterium]MCW5866041.1 ATP-binding cassette domain-containing protein [Candidatus Eremiobacteraeota bacterium]